MEGDMDSVEADHLNKRILELKEDLAARDQEIVNLEHRLEEKSEVADAYEDMAEACQGKVYEAREEFDRSRSLTLEVLKAAERSLDGSCPVCWADLDPYLQPKKHVTGCKLKLEIWRLETEITQGKAMA